MRKSIGSSLLLAMATVGLVYGAEQGISGRKVTLKKTISGQRLHFTSKDPWFLFPAGADVPTASAMKIELLSHNEGIVSFTVPTTDWTARPGLFKFKNSDPGDPQIRRVTLKQSKAITIKGKTVGLLMAGTQQSIGVRLTNGGTVNCAIFKGESVIRDQIGLFVGRIGAPAIPTDCSDATLLGSPGAAFLD